MVAVARKIFARRGFTQAFSLVNWRRKTSGRASKRITPKWVGRSWVISFFVWKIGFWRF